MRIKKRKEVGQAHLGLDSFLSGCPAARFDRKWIQD